MTTRLRRRSRPTASRCRPTLSRLEDRTVPTIWVTSTADDGPGTLRDALAIAGDGEEIRFAKLSENVIHLTSGQLTVGTSVTIDGDDVPGLAIQRDGVDESGFPTLAFRIFEVMPKLTVRIEDLTVRYGLLGQMAVKQPIISFASGGGIYNHESASLTATESLVIGNSAYSSPAPDGTGYAQGGGIQNDGTAELIDTTVHNNIVGGGTWIYDAPHYCDGGAGISNWGQLTLNRVVVSDNLVGILADPFPDPPPEPIGRVSGNAGGGGISSPLGTALTLTRSVLSSNLVGADSVDNSPVGESHGGALALGGQATITDSVIDGNFANHGPKVGRAGFAKGAGVFVDETGNLTMVRTAVTNNYAHADRSRGGGLYVLGSADLTNTTVSNNLASWVVIPPSRAWNQYGGGIAVMGFGQLTLHFCTVVDNNATTYFPNGVPGNGDVEGGGVFVANTATASFNNSIVARNQAGAGPAPFMDHPDTPGQDVYGQVLTDGYNLVRNADESLGWAPTDLTGTTLDPLDPVLGPLADNGGPVVGFPLEPTYQRVGFTHEVLNGSPALQAGNAATAPVTDQRGVPRDQRQPNIGAYEATLEQFLVTTDSWGNQVYAGSAFNVTVTAADRFGKTVYVYRGTIHFDTSDPDPNVILPSDYTFTAADAGQVTFYWGATLWTPGLQQIIVSDAGQPAIDGILEVDVISW